MNRVRHELIVTCHWASALLAAGIHLQMRFGYARRKTGSTANTVLILVMNNIILLTLGQHFFGH